MKAMILAAGKGTRVQPITNVIPKPMLPLVRKPVMEFLIEHLRRHGVKEIVINTSHLAPLIELYFRDGERHGVEIAYSFEGELANGELKGKALGSAGGMRRIQDFSGFFDETFAVICGDALIDVDLSAVLRFHRAKKSIATLVLRDVEPHEVSRYGVVKLDEESRIVGFQEKPQPEQAVSNVINTGIYLFEPEIFRYVPAGVEFDIGGQLLPALARSGAPIYGMSLPFVWVDIGSIPDFWQATRLVLGGGVGAFGVPGREYRPGVYGGINLQVNWNRVHIEGPVYIGSSSAIGDGAVIVGPTAVGSSCAIERNATLRECILADYTRVRSGAVLEQKLVFGSKCIDPDGKFLDIDESQIGWIVDDARKAAPLSGAEFELWQEVQAMAHH